MDLQVLFLALIVSIFAPLMLAMMNGRQQRVSKKQDWDRQDELEKRAEDNAEKRAAKTAADLKASNALVASKVDEVAIKAETVAVKVDEVAVAAAVAQVETRTQLVQIHTLVNSDMTAARQELLDQTKLSLTTLKKIVADDVNAGRVPSESDVAAISETEARIGIQKIVLAERLAQQHVVEQQQKEALATQAELDARRT